MPGGRAKPLEIYQIEVTLRASQPPIWRRIQVRGDTILAELHRILQCTLGWTDTHLHRFIIRGEHYGVPDEDNPGARQTKDERQYRLDEVAPDAPFTYTYDFGDNWEHILEIEKTLLPEEGVR